MLEQKSKYLNSIRIFPFFISFFCWNEIKKKSSIKEHTRKMGNYKTNHILERSRHRKFSVRKDVLRNFAKLTGKHLCQGLLMSGHIACTFIKKRLWHSKKKAERNFRSTFLKNHFRHLKLHSNAPSWLGRGRCHMGSFWKTKDWSSHFWEDQPFRFWYVEFYSQRRLKSTKKGISS